MAAIGREYLIQLVGGDSKEESSDWLSDPLQSILWTLFPNEPGRDVWRHASAAQLWRGPARCFSKEIETAAETYLWSERLHRPDFDWVLADALVFTEVNATVAQLSPSLMFDKKGEPIVWMMFAKGAWQLACWAVWALVIFVIYDKSALAAVGAVLATAAYQYLRRRALATRAKLLASMADVYGALDCNPPSWRNVYALMEKSRDLGAKWPTPLFRLVERAMRQA